MRILAACSLGGAGHLNPLLPFLRAAGEQGHETLVVGPAALEETVLERGHRFWSGGEPAEAEIAPIRELLPVVPSSEASVLGNRELFGRMATAAMLPRMREAFDEWAPDLVLREPCEYASAVVALATSTPMAQVAISTAEVECGSIEAAAPALEEHREGLTGELRSAPYLTRFPASLDPSPFAATIRYREENPRLPEMLPDWWGRRDTPLVYMTFGTVLPYMSMAPDVYRAALDAVSGLDVRVLLTVGHRFDRALLEAVPDNVHVEAWVDQERVLGEASLVLCHGGSGTVFGALAAGVPLVVVPVFADQFDNGRRVAGAGAAMMVGAGPAEGTGGRQRDREPATPAWHDPPMIRSALLEVLGRDSYRTQARGVSAEMSATPTASEVLAQLLARLA